MKSNEVATHFAMVCVVRNIRRTPQFAMVCVLTNHVLPENTNSPRQVFMKRMRIILSCVVVCEDTNHGAGNGRQPMAWILFIPKQCK